MEASYSGLQSDSSGVAVLDKKVMRALLKCFHCTSTTKSKRKLLQHIQKKHMNADAKEDKNCRRTSHEDPCEPSKHTLLKASRNCETSSRENAEINLIKHEKHFGQQPSSSEAPIKSEDPHRNSTPGNTSPGSNSVPDTQNKPNAGSSKKQHHCSYCGYLAVSAGKLAVHVRTHTGEKPFTCSYCDYACSNKSGLNSHTRKYHTGEKLHCCPHCSYKSLRPGHLERHIRKHTGEKPFGCAMCEASFTCMDYLNDHVRDFHNKERLFACPYCDKKMSRPGYFEAHLRTHSKKPDAVLIDSTDIPQKSISTLLNSFECLIDTRDSIPGEITADHPKNEDASEQPTAVSSPTADSVDGETVFSCTLCDFKCSSPEDLKVHVRVHKTVKPYKCHICPYTCKAQDKLQMHIAIHTGDKPFQCPHCDARFTLQSRLNQHVVIHDEGKRQKCPECDYVCYRNTDMRKHMPKHTGERNYICSVCFKNFVSSSSVRSHMRHVHSSRGAALKINSSPSFCEQDGMAQPQSTSCAP